MEIMFLLVPMTLAITAVAIGFLWWAIDAGQYDDVDHDGVDAVFGDAPDSDDP